MNRIPKLGPKALVCSLAATAILVTSATADAEITMASSTGGTMPLVEESLVVRVDQQMALSHIEHRFRNPWNARVEGRYDMNLGEGAQIGGFAYWNGEEKIVGEVLRFTTAANVYFSVSRPRGIMDGTGRDPGLLVRTGDGSYSLRVFPFEAHEVKRIAIDVERWLPRGPEGVELWLPVSHENASIDVTLEDPRPIGEVTSPSHELEVERAADGSVRLRGRGAGRRGELVIRYQLLEPAWTLAVAAHHDTGEDAYVVLSLPVPAATEDEPRDVTLVLDRSGSMGGEPLARARKAARELVGRLGPRDRVNVIAFDGTAEPLFDAPRKLTDTVRQEVLAYLGKRTPTGWGSAYKLAIAAALKRQVQDDQPDVVVLFSDGESDSQVLTPGWMAETPGDARIFALGFGPWLDERHLGSMARGGLVLVPGDDDLERTVGRLATFLESTPLGDAKLEADGARLEALMPETPLTALGGQELRLVGRLVGTAEATLRLRGSHGGVSRTVEAKLDLGKPAARPWVARLWAQVRVEQLLAGLDAYEPDRGTVEEITELGLKYGLVTPYTSFLAIPESELTAWSRAQLEEARRHKDTLYAADPGAARLSRDHMPPGDPVLSVRAPHDAQSVTAYFPFGLVRELHYDAVEEQWRTRFLVPTGVAPGSYDVTVVIVHAGGEVTLTEVRYVIDSQVDAISVATEKRDGKLRLRVHTSERCREVRVAIVGRPEQPGTNLVDNGSHQQFEAFVALPRGSEMLRLVVTDEALNERVEMVEVGP